MSTMHHLCISLTGALKNFRASEWKGCCSTKTGRPLSGEEVRQHFIDCLAKGWKVIPFGEPCEGFDYSGGGCPGHPMPEPAGPPPWGPPHLQTRSEA